MCGAYYLYQSAGLRSQFGIESPDDLKNFLLDGDRLDPKQNPLALFDGHDEHELLQVFRPTDTVPFLALDRAGQWIGRTATWWLALNREGDHWTPNQKLATFNSRLDKIVRPSGTIHHMPPRSFRVILPASGFVEWHEGRPHLFRRSDGEAVMIGGMAKAYTLKGGEGHQFAVSIVTLPGGHEKTSHIHAKSIPLLLTESSAKAWLDRTKQHSDFAHWLVPTIPYGLTIQAVENLKERKVAGEPETVRAD